MKHIHTFESFLNEGTVKDPKLRVGASITIELDDQDGDFYAGDYQVVGLTRGGVIMSGMGKNKLEVSIGALNDAGYTVNEKNTYLEGAKNTGDAILDKFAKLINSGSSTVEITNGQVRGKNVTFGFSPASTFFVSNKDDYYFMNTNKGYFRVDKKDIAKAEDLYDELESIIQAEKTKRPSSRETDMFGKK
jgi:hypothetical protein